jgi:hypothetical protein
MLAPKIPLKLLAVLTCLAALGFANPGCIPKILENSRKNDNAKREMSQSEAIRASIADDFGNVVDSYMWGLTTNNPEAFQTEAYSHLPLDRTADSSRPTELRQNGSSVQLGLEKDEFEAESKTGKKGMPPVPPYSPGQYTQCWYKTDVTLGVGGRKPAELKQLFLKSSNVNSKFITGEAIVRSLRKHEDSKRLMSFAMSIAPVAVCGAIGVAPDIPAVGADARVKIAVKLTGVFCSLAAAWYMGVQGNYHDYDMTWGNFDARKVVNDAITQKVNRVVDVKPNVLNAVYQRVNAFDTDLSKEPDISAGRTEFRCPKATDAVAQYIDDQASEITPDKPQPPK